MYTFSNRTVATMYVIVNNNTTGWYPVHDVVSKDIRRTVETVCYGGVTTLLCVVGIPTNLMNVLVFWRQGLRDRMNLCLFSLALVDGCYLLLTFLTQCLITIGLNLGSLDIEQYTLTINTYLTGLISGLRSTSGCITMVIALERCLCVVYPLHAARLMLTRTMALILLSFSLAFQIFYIIIPVSYQLEIVKLPDDTLTLFVPTRFCERNPTFVYVVGNVLLGTLMPVVSFLTVTVATTITLKKLSAAMTWREKTSVITTSASHNHQLTTMLVLVCCVYIVTMAPVVVHQAAFYFISDCVTSGVCYNSYMTVVTVVNVLSNVNSSFPFFVYFLRSSRFRKAFHSFFNFTDTMTANSLDSTSRY